MNKRAGTIVAIAVGMILYSDSLLAQRNDSADREARRVAVKELRERYREWAQAEIVPKLSEWKRTLDASMAPEDLSVLNDLRAEAKELRRTIRRSVLGLGKAWREEDYETLKEHRAQLSEARRKQLDIFDLLIPLAIEYRETLKEIGAAAKPHIGIWRTEGKRIWDEWKAEHAGDGAHEAGRFVGIRAFLGGLLDPKIEKGMRAIRFMLWDGGGETENEIDTDEPDFQ